jgi:NAD(P)-dependent dehydrogenase (short-subunit alcohol dehydrogenase family)
VPEVYIFSARKAAVCDSTAAELSAGNGRCISLPQGVSVVEGCRSLAAAYAKHETSLDILVNNAGAAWLAEFDGFPENGWDKVVDLNLKCPSS